LDLRAYFSEEEVREAKIVPYEQEQAELNSSRSTLKMEQIEIQRTNFTTQNLQIRMSLLKVLLIKQNYLCTATLLL
jgi:hypothetical protein